MTNCKLCGSRHWAYQDHSVVEVPEYVKEMARGALQNTVTKRNNVTPVTEFEKPLVKGKSTPRPSPLGHSVDKRQTTGRESNPLPQQPSTRGRPKKYAANADRQKAYRERSR